MLTISEHIMIGETISHDAKAILRGPPSFYMEERTLVWYYDFLWERCDHVYSFFTRDETEVLSEQ